MYYYYLGSCRSFLVHLNYCFYSVFQFLSNVKFCVQVFLTKFPGLEESLQTLSGRAELIAALSICAEQTFTQASAKEQGFSTAFSTALSAYGKSTVMEDVDKAIRDLDLAQEEYREKLVHIITKHPLCINTDTA
ncbi:hypothetical protein GALMADRAFT_1238572 [Galerina marginata CBS 339.88]|uniref:Uncharacterized protein n=1 Tax=Galerina marginata (strain CBS 339.88) TaxID=685588 RepID=A0A067T8E5_GALM3|nr:hypothetical protein GALMADRAFT_1238572 [Galerina marginata CBS 339.88]